MTMNKFFNPKSIAIIGASATSGKVGNVIFKNFLESGYKGKVYPVNPKYDKIYSTKCYPSVGKIKGSIDLAVISIPAPYVEKTLEECGKKGIKNVIIISGGFKEIGNDREEKQLKIIADRYKMRVIGPNTLGVFDPYTGVDTFFLPRQRLGRPDKGSIAFISQSGAVSSTILDWMDRRGYKASKFIAYGNAVDIDESDLIEFLAKDKTTKVICAYLEGVKDGRRFMNAVKKSPKPVIVLKGGVTEKGGTAVSSHTGSLAGSSEVFSAALKQCGAIEAKGMEQIFDFARTLDIYGKISSNRVQVVTNGGGFGILTVDDIVKNDLELAKMSKATEKKVRESMPDYAVTGNPIDLTGDSTAQRYRDVLDHLAKDKNIDMIALIGLLQVPTLDDDIVDVVLELKQKTNKPIFFIAAGGDYTEVIKKNIELQDVPTFSWPKQAVDAMRALYEYSN